MKNVMSEAHCLKLQVLAERYDKERAQMQNVEAQLASLKATHSKTVEEFNAHKVKMGDLYKMSPADQVNLETGAITRAPKEDPKP